MKKGEQMERAIKVVLAFQSGPVTSRKLADKLGISYISANRWIHMASRVMPIVEAGFDNGDMTRGRPPIIYELMSDIRRVKK